MSFNDFSNFEQAFRTVQKIFESVKIKHMRTVFQRLTSRIALSILFILSLAAIAALAIALQHYKKTAKPIVIDRRLLEQKIAAQPPDWMLNRIKIDLARFSEQGISREIIDDLFQGERISKYSLIRFKREGESPLPPSSCRDQKTQ